MGRPRLTDDQVREKLLANVRKNEVCGCWNWLGNCQFEGGYGRLKFRNVRTLAHRVSWTVFKGEIPVGMFVLHRCDNPRCINPGHLFLGTLEDNNQDMCLKGRDRKARGEKASKAKLTTAQVREMRRLYLEGVRIYQLAPIFGINRSSVGAIVRGKNWVHV